MALNDRQLKKPGRIKMIKAHKPPTQETENRIDEETYVPLVAKDSGWVDLRFHNANHPSYSQINGDADGDDEVMIEICEGESSSRQSPMALLFPNLSETVLTRKTSPTAITKLLVGQKVNLKCLRNTKKQSQFSQDLPPLVETSSETASENPE